MAFKRILQDNHGTIAGLRDADLSRFICVQCRDDGLGQPIPSLFLLQTANSNSWHRFFLDTGICYWDEYDHLPQDDLSDSEIYPWVDLGHKFHLNGLRIISIDAAPQASGVRLTITMSQGRKVEISTRHPEDDMLLQINPGNGE